MRAVLESAVLKRKTKLRPLLQYLVMRALDNIPVTETLIGKDVFGRENLKDDDGIVRVNASHLRDELEEYYALEAPDALVRIDLPTGPAYRVVFDYNPRSETEKVFRVGMFHLRQQSASDMREALAHFERTLALSSSHAGALACKAEALCTIAMYSPDVPPQESISAAESAAVSAIHYAGKSWRSHVANGIVLLCKRELNGARTAFDNALKLNPVDTRDHIWYPAYLMSSGRAAEAVRTTRSGANDKPDDPEARRVFGMYLYLNRQYDESEKVLSEVLRMDRNSWLAHLTIAFVYLATGNPKDASAHMQKADALLENPAWPGLSALCFAQSGDEGTAQGILADLKATEGYVQPLQLALAFLACGEQDQAIVELERACEECDPFMIWLGQLPVFDPLDSHPRFQALLMSRG